jgi:hypothetical protein
MMRRRMSDDDSIDLYADIERSLHLQTLRQQQHQQQQQQQLKLRLDEDIIRRDNGRRYHGSQQPNHSIRQGRSQKISRQVEHCYDYSTSQQSDFTMERKTESRSVRIIQREDSGFSVLADGMTHSNVYRKYDTNRLSQSVPRSIQRGLESECLPRSIESQSIPQVIESQCLPRSIESQSITRGLENQSVPRGLVSQSIPRSIESQSIPRSIESQSIPRSIESQSIPRNKESRQLSGQSSNSRLRRVPLHRGSPMRLVKPAVESNNTFSFPPLPHRRCQSERHNRSVPMEDLKYPSNYDTFVLIQQRSVSQPRCFHRLEDLHLEQRLDHFKSSQTMTMNSSNRRVCHGSNRRLVATALSHPRIRPSTDILKGEDNTCKQETLLRATRNTIRRNVVKSPPVLCQQQNQQRQKNQLWRVDRLTLEDSNKKKSNCNNDDTMKRRRMVSSTTTKLSTIQRHEIPNYVRYCMPNNRHVDS